MTDESELKPTDLSSAMQAHIVAMVLREPGFMGRVRPVMNPDYFEDTALSDIVAWTNQHWDQNKEVPSKQALLDCFRNDQDLVRSLYKHQLPDPAHTQHRIVQFARLRAVKLAILKGGEVISAELRGEKLKDERGKVVDVDLVDLMKKAVLTGKDLSDIGEQVEDVLEGDIREILCPPTSEKLLTGLQHLDEAGIYLERGEIGCVLGASKRGKSHVLINIAYGCLKNGLRVIYYTLEMPSKKVRRRLHLRVAGSKADIKQDPQAFVDILRERYPRLIKGKMLIKRYPSRGATVDDLRAHLTTVVGQGFKPDVVIVDYGGILKPVRASGEVRHDLAEIYLQLRAIAGEFNVGMWTAAQANRGAVNKELVTMADFAECFEIVQHLDAGFSVCMTDEEKERGEGRFFVLAARNEPDGTIITFNHDYSRSMIQTTGVQRPVAEKKRRDKDTSGPMAGPEAAIQAQRLRDNKRKQERDNV